MITMTSWTYFWAIAGFMAGLAVAFFVLRLWQGGIASLLGRVNGWLLATIAVFLFGALAIYSKVGRPELATNINSGAGAGLPANHAAVQGNADAGSMADVVAKLAAKLARGEGSDADWQLLQQSYEFMGDTQAAALAAQHKLPSSTTTSDAGTAGGGNAAAAMVSPSTDADLIMYQKRVAANPRDAASWRALAESYRTARRFKEANAAFAELIKLKAMDADAWADYADASASQLGSLANEQTRSALTAALKLNSTHHKALWLQASLLLEEKKYPESLKVWRQLRALIPEASPDAKIIDANIAEAQSLVQGQGPAGNAAAVNVQGSVSIDSSLNNKVSGMTLFVFAKTAESPMPVAVYRTAVSKWPVQFTLDDSQAVMPTRKLSDTAQVLVQARLSQSGQAMAQPGDWQSDAVMVSTRAGKPVVLRITQPVSGKAGS